MLGIAGDAVVDSSFQLLMDTPESFNVQVQARIDAFAGQLIATGGNIKLQASVLRTMLNEVNEVPVAVKTMGDTIQVSINSFRVCTAS